MSKPPQLPLSVCFFPHFLCSRWVKLRSWMLPALPGKQNPQHQGRGCLFWQNAGPRLQLLGLCTAFQLRSRIPDLCWGFRGCTASLLPSPLPSAEPCFWHRDGRPCSLAHCWGSSPAFAMVTANPVALLLGTCRAELGSRSRSPVQPWERCWGAGIGGGGSRHSLALLGARAACQMCSQLERCVARPAHSNPCSPSFPPPPPPTSPPPPAARGGEGGGLWGALLSPAAGIGFQNPPSSL